MHYDRFQKEAVAHIDAGSSVIISAPTGAGKTVVAEYAIEKAIREGVRVIYTSPIKALSNQKYRDFCKSYPGEVGIVTGDVSIEQDRRILVMTTEIYRNMLFTDDVGSDVAWVVFDEIHYLDDPVRGSVWEESIMFSPTHIRFVCLSATIPNLNELADWIEEAHGASVARVKETNRPVPLDFYFQIGNRIVGAERLAAKYFQIHRRQHPHEEKHALRSLIETIVESDQVPCIYFCFGRKRVEMLARYVSAYDVFSKAEGQRIVSEFWELCLKYGIEEHGSSARLADCLKSGVAYHHAGMIPSLKEVVEILYTRGRIKMIFTTETFALGINMPVRTVVFDTLRKTYGSYFGDITTRDFYQMAGRAGRRGKDSMGYVYSRIQPRYMTHDSVFRIVNGKTDPVKSQFTSSYGTLLNLYMMFGERLADVYSRSFHCYQYSRRKRKDALWQLKAKIHLLESDGYIQDKTLSMKGKFASRMFGYELFLGCLFETGVLDSIDIQDLAPLIAAVLYEPRGNELLPPLSMSSKYYKEILDPYYKHIRKLEKRFSIIQHTKRPYYTISDAVREWASGAPFKELQEITCADEGEIVRYMRMTIQLLGHLSASQELNIKVRDKCRKAIALIKRDVIDAERQLSVI